MNTERTYKCVICGLREAVTPGQRCDRCAEPEWKKKIGEITEDGNGNQWTNVGAKNLSTHDKSPN